MSNENEAIAHVTGNDSKSHRKSIVMNVIADRQRSASYSGVENTKSRIDSYHNIFFGLLHLLGGF